jgi:hypothetical protein
MGIAMVPRSDTKPTKPAVAQTQLKEKSIVAITIDKTSSKKRKRTLQKKSEEQKETQAKVPEKQAEEPKEERAHLLEEESDEEDTELLAAARVWADDATEQNVKEQHEIEKTFNFDEKQTPKESTVEDTEKVYSLHLTQLSYEANEFEIRTIFSEAGCLIQSIRLVYDGIGAELLGRKMNVRPTKTKDELTDIVARTKEIVSAKIQRQKDIQDGKENPVSDKRADKKDKKSFDKKDKTRFDKKDKKSFDKKEKRSFDKKDKKSFGKKEKKSFDKKDKKSFDKKDEKEFINDKQKRKSDVDSEVTLPNKKAKIMNGRSNHKTKEGSREPKGHSYKQSETQEKIKSSMTKPDASKPRPTISKVIGSGEVTKLTKQERNRKAAILMGKRRAK